MISNILFFIECHCMLFLFRSVNVPITGKTPGDFAFGVHARKSHHDIVATAVAPSLLSLSVCTDPYEKGSVTQNTIHDAISQVTFSNILKMLYFLV